MDMQTIIFDVRSLWKASCLPISLPVSFFLISVTKLWDMIICLCMCKGQTNHVKVLKYKSHCMMAKTFGFFLQVNVKWQCKSNISNQMCYQNSSEWCHTCHGKSGQCAWRINHNDNRHAKFTHVSNCITLRTDLVRMVEIFQSAYGTSWKSKRRSWIRNGEEVELYSPQTNEMNHMPSIAGRMRGNVIGAPHFSLR